MQGAEKLTEIEASCEPGVLEEVVMMHFTRFQKENVARDDLFFLADALINNGTRRIKKEMDRRIKQLKISSRLFRCLMCGCVFKNPITLACCGRNICLACIPRESAALNGEHSEGNVTSCPLCGEHNDNNEPFSVNVILSNLIRKQFPEQAIHEEAKNHGKIRLSSNATWQAIDSFSFAHHISTGDYDCLCLRSDAYSELRLYYLALRDAENACKLRPELPDAFRKKARILTKVKRFDDAVTEYLRCAVLAPTESDRRAEFIDSLFRVFTSPEIKKFEQRIIARKLTNIFFTDERFGDEIPTGAQLQPINAVFSPQSDDGFGDDEQESFDLSRAVEKAKFDVDDLKCGICSQLLFRPVTTQCGHSFCQECLKESLECGLKCPSCDRTLNDSDKNKSQVTAMLDKITRAYFERQYSERARQHRDKMDTWKRMGVDKRVEIPILIGSIPIPCDRVQLIMPHPSLRIMIRRCIEWGSRMFGICAPDEDSEKGFADFGTLVEIQATERFPDNNLVVHAVPKRNFLVLSRGIMDGCFVGKVDWLEGAKINDSGTILQLKWCNAATRVLLEKWLSTLPIDQKTCIVSALGPMPPCESHLILTANGPSWLWWALAALPLIPQEKLRIMIMPSVIDKLQSVLKFLCLLLKLSKARKCRNVNGSDQCTCDQK